MRPKIWAGVTGRYPKKGVESKSEPNNTLYI